MVIDSSVVRWFRAAAVTICPVIFIDREVRGQIREDLLVHERVHWWQQLWFGVVGAVIGAAVWFMLAWAQWPPKPLLIFVMLLGVVEGWVAGQLLWRWLYLVGLPFSLPVGWNWFRRRWETRAFRAEGRSPESIRRTLRNPPYYLWWHND